MEARTELLGGGGEDDGILYRGIANGALGLSFEAVNSERARGVEVGVDERGLIAVAADAVEHGDARQIRKGDAGACDRAIAGDVGDVDGVAA